MKRHIWLLGFRRMNKRSTKEIQGCDTNLYDIIMLDNVIINLSIPTE